METEICEKSQLDGHIRYQHRTIAKFIRKGELIKNKQKLAKILIFGSQLYTAETALNVLLLEETELFLEKIQFLFFSMYY